ncbi:hypothetical protein ACW7EJ_02075, partial [Acinetobacter soli]
GSEDFVFRVAKIYAFLSYLCGSEVTLNDVRLFLIFLSYLCGSEVVLPDSRIQSRKGRLETGKIWGKGKKESSLPHR